MIVVPIFIFLRTSLVVKVATDAIAYYIILYLIVEKVSTFQSYCHSRLIIIIIVIIIIIIIVFDHHSIFYFWSLVAMAIKLSKLACHDNQTIEIELIMMIIVVGTETIMSYI